MGYADATTISRIIILLSYFLQGVEESFKSIINAENAKEKKSCSINACSYLRDNAYCLGYLTLKQCSA